MCFRTTLEWENDDRIIIFGKLSLSKNIYFNISSALFLCYSTEHCRNRDQHVSGPYLHNALEVPHIGLLSLQYLQRHPLQTSEFGQRCCGASEGTGSRQQGERGEVQADVGAIALWSRICRHGSMGERWGGRGRVSILQRGGWGRGAETGSAVTVGAHRVNGGAAPTGCAPRGGHTAHDPTQRGHRGRALGSCSREKQKHFSVKILVIEHFQLLNEKKS